MKRKLFIKIKKKAIAILAITTILSTMVLTGCGKTSDESSSSSTVSTYTGPVTEIKIGIGNAFNPFCYLDENGKETGYDYEVIKAVDDLLPQYKFTYEATEFVNILVGLDSKKYDIAIHHYGWNATRAAKYLYAKVCDFPGSGYVIAAKPGRTFKTEADLQGLSVEVAVSSNAAFLLETYNKTLSSDKQVKLVYDGATSEQVWSNILAGVYDATIPDEFAFDQTNKAYGNTLAKYGTNVLQTVAGAGTDVGTYFIYNFGSEELQTAVDGALQTLIDDGTIAKISVKSLGKDYVTDGFNKIKAKK